MKRPIHARAVLRTTALLTCLITGSYANAGITFSFNFLDAAGTGFNDATHGADRRAALETAGTAFSSLFASHFTNSGTVVLDVTGSDDSSSGTLASAGSNLIDPGVAGFGGSEVIRTKLQGGSDLNGLDADGSVNVNFGQPWQLAIGTTPSASEFDFYSTLYHEFSHALGFASMISQSGAPIFGTKSAGTWGAFDQYLTDVSGNHVIDSSTFGLNQSTWDAASVGGTSPAAGLFFSGAYAMAANGGNRVGIYSPTTWVDGSSGSHLDDDNPALAGMMMLSASDKGPYARSFSNIEVGVFRDLGYTVSAVPEPETYALMIAGLLMLGFVAKRRRV